MKIDRELVRQKFNGLCAYSGKPLDDKWQVDHMLSKCRFGYSLQGKCDTREIYESRLKEVHHIDNLLPALRRVNHYKRALDLEGFRKYMLTFHLRLSKLPKKTLSYETHKRIEYMKDIANIFDITVDKPFSGVFYFETVNKNVT